MSNFDSQRKLWSKHNITEIKKNTKHKEILDNITLAMIQCLLLLKYHIIAMNYKLHISQIFNFLIMQPFQVSQQRLPHKRLAVIVDQQIYHHHPHQYHHHLIMKHIQHLNGAMWSKVYYVHH